MSSIPQLQPLNVSNLREHIERQVRAAILNGTFAPGERLVESLIADQLGVSRAPVREVLSALEREGIVTSVPRRGYFVADFTDKDIEEIYSLRLLLELEALKRAMQRLTAENIARLGQIVEELGATIDTADDPTTAIALDLSFHEELCRIADHSRLFSVWKSMRVQTWLLIGLTRRTHYEYPEHSKQIHARILSAMREKDLTRAEALLREHILDAQARATRVLRSLHAAEGS